MSGIEPGTSEKEGEETEEGLVKEVPAAHVSLRSLGTRGEGLGQLNQRLNICGAVEQRSKETSTSTRVVFAAPRKSVV